VWRRHKDWEDIFVMFLATSWFFPPSGWTGRRRGVVGLSLMAAALGTVFAWGESVQTRSKQIIGATATLTEVSTGISFSARIDTGAQSCSLHVEKIEIEDESNKRLRNVGKTVRFLVEGEDGKSEWIQTKIAKAVRVKSSALKPGTFDRRYKVPLTFEWNGFRKEVLVTLNDRTAMQYPLLIGRNYLKGDFLVDVEMKDEE
jgi:hypothetical protein